MISQLSASIGRLCRPAWVYLVLSLISIVLIDTPALMTDVNSVCSPGNVLSCALPSVVLVYALKLTYVGFWTWILHLICKEGYSTLSWILVLLPFVVVFGLLAFTN